MSVNPPALDALTQRERSIPRLHQLCRGRVFHLVELERLGRAAVLAPIPRAEIDAQVGVPGFRLDDIPGRDAGHEQALMVQARQDRGRPGQIRAADICTVVVAGHLHRDGDEGQGEFDGEDDAQPRQDDACQAQGEMGSAGLPAGGDVVQNVGERDTGRTGKDGECVTGGGVSQRGAGLGDVADAELCSTFFVKLGRVWLDDDGRAGKHFAGCRLPVDSWLRGFGPGALLFYGVVTEGRLRIGGRNGVLGGDALGGVALGIEALGGGFRGVGGDAAGFPGAGRGGVGFWRGLAYEPCLGAWLQNLGGAGGAAVGRPVFASRVFFDWRAILAWRPVA